MNGLGLYIKCMAKLEIKAHKSSGRSKSDVIRALLAIGLEKPPTSAYRDIIAEAIAEHEEKFHAQR